MTRSIDPTFTPIPTIREYGNEIASERAKRDFNPRRLFHLATAGTDLLMSLPHRLDLITERIAANELEAKIQVPQLLDVMTGMQKVANRIFSGLVVGSIVVASAMLMPYRRSLSTAGFILSGILGLWMVLTILWSDRKAEKKKT